MPSTAKLLAARGRTKVHAYLPNDDSHTLCGLAITFPPERPRRFYAGLVRPLCRRCVVVAKRIRPEAESVELKEVRR